MDNTEKIKILEQTYQVTTNSEHYLATFQDITQTKAAFTEQLYCPTTYADEMYIADAKYDNSNDMMTYHPGPYN